MRPLCDIQIKMSAMQVGFRAEIQKRRLGFHMNLGVFSMLIFIHWTAEIVMGKHRWNILEAPGLNYQECQLLEAVLRQVS